MKKMVMLVLVVCLMVTATSTCFAMSDYELNKIKADMQAGLDQAQEVSWDELNNNPDPYRNKLIKFNGNCIGIGNDCKNIGLKDSNGHLWVVAQGLPYRFKLNANYTMAAYFVGMVTPPGDETAAVFSTETAHLPVMDEWFN